jgi:hypothetical protein
MTRALPTVCLAVALAALAACGSNPAPAPTPPPTPSSTASAVDATPPSATGTNTVADAPSAPATASTASTATASTASASSTASTAPTATPPDPATGSAKAGIGIVPFRATVDHDSHIFAIELLADGKVTVDGKSFANVQGDSVVSSFGRLQLKPDGTVIVSFDKETARFTAEGALTDGKGGGMRLLDDGTAEIMDRGKSRKVPLKVLDMQPGKRRTALLVCVATLGFLEQRERMEQDNTPPPVPPPPPPPMPPPPPPRH